MQTLHANTYDNSKNTQIPCKSYREPHTCFLFFGFYIYGFFCYHSFVYPDDHLQRYNLILAKGGYKIIVGI